MEKISQDLAGDRLFHETSGQGGPGGEEDHGDEEAHDEDGGDAKGAKEQGAAELPDGEPGRLLGGSLVLLLLLLVRRALLFLLIVVFVLQLCREREKLFAKA